MVMSRSTAVGSIVTGSIMLCFAIVTVICGAVAAHKLSGQAASSAGLWSLYVSFYLFMPTTTINVFHLVATYVAKF